MADKQNLSVGIPLFELYVYQDKHLIYIRSHTGNEQCVLDAVVGGE